MAIINYRGPVVLLISVPEVVRRITEASDFRAVLADFSE